MRYTPALVKPLSGVTLAAVLLAFVAARADAQTLPLRTEPAVTAPGGTLVLETSMEAIADEPSYVTGVERTRWDGPLLRLVYSPAANVELDVEWVVRVGVVGEEGRGDIQSSEWGDVTLRAKWRIVEGKGRRPTLGARFGVILPQTSFEDVEFNPLGLGPNTLRAFVEGLLTQPVGRGRLHVNAGLFLQDEVYRAARPAGLPLLRPRLRVARDVAPRAPRRGGGSGRRRPAGGRRALRGSGRRAHRPRPRAVGRGGAARPGARRTARGARRWASPGRRAGPPVDPRARR